MKVLDKGFVNLLSCDGTDTTIVQAARVSYGAESKGAEQDKKLINYLMIHDHGSPFEQVNFRFHVKCPIFVARQWFRHRIGSFNEISGRYTEVKDEYYVPTDWRAQDTKNKQGSVKDDSLQSELLSQELKLICEESFNFYKRFLAKGVSREMARMVLPMNTYTEFHWSVNARSLMNFVKLRADEHAQLEIREYALSIQNTFEEKLPWTAEAFKRKNATR